MLKGLIEGMGVAAGSEVLVVELLASRTRVFKVACFFMETLNLFPGPSASINGAGSTSLGERAGSCRRPS